MWSYAGPGGGIIGCSEDSVFTLRKMGRPCEVLSTEIVSSDFFRFWIYFECRVKRIFFGLEYSSERCKMS